MPNPAGLAVSPPCPAWCSKGSPPASSGESTPQEPWVGEWLPLECPEHSGGMPPGSPVGRHLGQRSSLGK